MKGRMSSYRMKKYTKAAYSKYPAVRRRAKVYVPAMRQLASDIMYVKSLINSEPKYHIVRSQFNYAWDGTVVSLSDIPQGDGSTNRDGDRVLPRYLSFRAHINTDVAGLMHKTVRIIIFRWWGESPNVAGVAPVASDIVDSTLSVYAPLSHLDPTITGPKGDRQRRIEVHLSKQFTFDNVGTTFVDFVENIEINGKNSSNKEHMEFYDNTTNPPTSGGFFVMCISDNATATNQNITLESKLTYYDN